MPRRSPFIEGFETTAGDLPHWEDLGASYFVRFSLWRPPAVNLAAPECGPTVVGALRFYDGQRYWLFDYTVMPDHVHMIVQPIVRDGRAERLSRIMSQLKHWIARRLNEQLGRSGPLWQKETYDHIIRNHEDYLEKAAYILDNPRRAGLVSDPTDWPWWGTGSCGTGLQERTNGRRGATPPRGW